MTEYIAEAKNLTVEFSSRGAKKHRALDSLSFSLERGETLSIVGESGSGKSTLLRAMMALLPHVAGEALLFGKNTAGLSMKELNNLRRRCGYVPQDPYGALPPGLSVLEAVIEPSIIAQRSWSKGCRIERAKKLLLEVGLRDERIAASRAVGLSGGQRQRVELARALMLEPELLLCDEPTSMQDASTRGELIELLKGRVEAGMSMIFVTHDLLLASRAARKILVLKEGRLCESGNASEVFSAPKHEYTKALLEALPRFTKN